MLGDDNDAKIQYTTTVMEKFGLKDGKEKAKVSYKDRGLQRFDPITG